jgi:hypothetical protein
MKNYSNYIFEAKNPDFNTAYSDIENKLTEFWVALDDSLDILGEIKTRDPNEVSKENSKVSAPAPAPVNPVMPEAGKQYNYITQGNKHEVVEIIEPNAQDKNKSALPNTAIVKTITPPTNNTHPAEWSRLVPTKKTAPAP